MSRGVKARWRFEMAFITGCADAARELIRKIGIDPSRCVGVTIHIEPHEVVVADVVVLVDEETIEFITKHFKFIDGKSDTSHETE